jgi:ADP-heptose:LPS heptosyltransferase
LSKHSEILLTAESIAIVRTDKIGDMMLTLPMVNAIRSINPSAKISIIASNYTKSLLKNISEIDQALYIEDFAGGVDELFENNQFDVAFFPRPKYEETRAASKAGVPLRVGSAFRIYSIFYNHRVRDHRKKGTHHEAEYNCRQIASVVGQEVETKLIHPQVQKETIEALKEKLAAYDINEKYMIIHPGSGGSAYDWSAENFGKAAEIISRKHGLIPVISGIDSEMELCKKVQDECPAAINLCGQLTLDEAIALISGASLFTSNSTGVLHIAASFDVPVLGLYPNTSHISARRWGPRNGRSAVVSPPNTEDKSKCDDMSLIEVSSVVAAAGELLT